MLAIESVSQHLLGWKVSDCIGQSFEVLQGPETDKKILHGALHVNLADAAMPIKFYVATGETALLYVTVHHSCGHLRTEATSACCILTLSLQPDACVCDAWALLSSTEPFRMVQVGQSLACFLDTGARDSSKCDKGFLDLILSSTFWKPAQDLLRQAAASGARGNIQVRVRYTRVGEERPMSCFASPFPHPYTCLPASWSSFARHDKSNP